MDQILEVKDSLMNEEFDTLANSRQRVEYTFEKLGDIEGIRHTIQKFVTDHKNENLKSLKKSQTFREKGNLYFSKNNYEYSLYYFSSAIMCAPYPDESGAETHHELAYAFTARSLTFFEMKAYENALFDINSALNLSEFSMKFTERLQLMTHKVYCLCRLNRYYTALAVITAVVQLVPCLPVYNQTINSLIKMKDQIFDRINEESEESDDTKQAQNELDSIERHLKNIESFRTPELELHETESKGRHYRASEPISKGKIVAVEKAITGILFKPFFATHCQYCFKNIGYKIWPCRQCSQVVFCDQECADSAYHHKYECGIVDVLHNLGTNPHLLFRIILLVGPEKALELAEESDNFTDYLNNESDKKKLTYLKFAQLIDHKDKYCLKTKIPSICRSIQTAFLLDSFEDLRPKYDSTETYLKELSALLDTFNYKAFVNVFGMYEHMSKGRAFRGSHIGNALMYESSFFNHSCSPNAYWLFNGQYISVVTTKAIEKDQEVNISYGPYSQSMSFEERQEFLMKRYFFRCNCNECVNEAKKQAALKCNYCSDGFFLIPSESDLTESLCMICSKSLDISSVLRRVKETEYSFNQWMSVFEGDTNEVTLIRAEMCFKDFARYLHPKSQQMIEINTKLSRSFETIEDYSKAMFYSKNILNSMEENGSFQYCIEMSFYSRVFYHYLYKQRKILNIDNDWMTCFETIRQSLVILQNYKAFLVRKMEDKSFNSSESETITKAIQLIDDCLKSKNRQICIIQKMIDNSSPKPMEH